MSRDERHRIILGELAGESRVDVRHLATQFGVTEMTIRRDLTTLDGEGKLSRVHGGARPTKAPEYEFRAHSQSEQKDRIARVVADRIPDGAVVGIDMGSTCQAVAHHLAMRSDLTVATYSLRVALAFNGSKSHLILLGGELTDELTLVGGESDIPLNFDVLVLGCAGVDASSVSCFTLPEARVRRAMIARASRLILAADASKFGQRGPVNYAKLSQLDMIVTDQPLRPETREIIPSSTEIIVAE